jgi:hypothetical protein
VPEKEVGLPAHLQTQLICPTGCSATIVSSPVRKNISLPALVETALLIRPSRPTKGRIAIVTDVRRDAVDAAVSGAQSWIAGRVSRERSAAHGRAIVLRTAKSCGPDAPTLASSCAGVVSPQPGATDRSRAATVAKEPGHRGEREVSRKTIACGNAG